MSGRLRRFLAAVCIAAMCMQAMMQVVAEETELQPVEPVQQNIAEETPAKQESVSEEPVKTEVQEVKPEIPEPTSVPEEKPTEVPSEVPVEENKSESVEPEETEVSTLEPTVAPEVTPEPENEEVPPSATEPEQTEVPPVVEKPTGVCPAETPFAEPSASENISDPEEKLVVQTSADRKYAFANETTVKITVKVSGGEAPYTVRISYAGALGGSKSEMLSGAGKCVFSCLPAKFGTLWANVSVEDSKGALSSVKVSVAVPEKERESKADWNKSVADVVLTGDWRIDLINIARSQLDYRESKRDYVIDAGGNQQAYTRYGDWYGLPYTEWCAMFASFCLHYAGISEWDFPYEARCIEWKQRLSYIDAYERAGGGYMPQTGDLVFFSWNGKDNPDHVGIVEFMDEDYIHTIEGNSEKRVRQAKYERDDDTIIGFGNTTYLMYRARGMEVPEDGGKYILPEFPIGGVIGKANGSNINVRNRATTDSAALTQISQKGDEVMVTDAVLENGVLWYFVEHDGFAGYVRGDLLTVDFAN